MPFDHGEQLGVVIAIGARRCRIAITWAYMLGDFEREVMQRDDRLTVGAAQLECGSKRKLRRIPCAALRVDCV